jgi:hypothetical protein
MRLISWLHPHGNETIHMYSMYVRTYGNREEIDEKDTHLSYMFYNRRGHQAPHFQTRDSSKLGQVSEHAPAKFGLGER